ncbi:MAG: riboflavin synthase [Alistipes sp.]|jgi:riboflavin synthase|nr:riboflavin synthase [Alistipes sp.]
MFSGIVEKMGRVVDIRSEQSNKHFTLEADFVGELKIDQSVSHNGVCLTVVELTGSTYTVTAMHETLVKSNLGGLRVGDFVNLERSMRPDALLDGHIVQGHVDQTAVCTGVEEADGSWYYAFEYTPDPAQRGHITVEKGSVAVNGVSLTVVDSRTGGFRVAIIPYTHENTNFRDIVAGSVVNIEFDIIGKYIARLMPNG